MILGVLVAVSSIQMSSQFVSRSFCLIAGMFINMTPPPCLLRSHLNTANGLLLSQEYFRQGKISVTAIIS